MPDGVTSIGRSASTKCEALKCIVAPNNLSISIEHLGVSQSTKIVTHHTLNGYIDTLNLPTNYPPHQKYVIYDLLHSNNPTQVQFATLSTFVAAEDFKIIIRQFSKENIPSNILTYIISSIKTPGMETLICHF